MVDAKRQKSKFLAMANVHFLDVHDEFETIVEWGDQDISLSLEVGARKHSTAKIYPMTTNPPHYLLECHFHLCNTHCA